MLPVPSVADLQAFSGRAQYGPFASAALTQATLFFSIVTRLTAMPSDPDLALLAKYAILQLADRLFLEQPYAEDVAKPYQSETIMSYSYSMGTTAQRARNGLPLGLFWWDLAVDELTVPGDGNVASGLIAVSDPELLVDADGQVFIAGPDDLDDGRPAYVTISTDIGTPR